MLLPQNYHFCDITEHGAAISVRQRSKDIEFGKLSILQTDPMHWTSLFIHVVYGVLEHGWG